MYQELPLSINTECTSTSPQMSVYFPVLTDFADQSVQYFVNMQIVNGVQQLIKIQETEFTTPIVEMLGLYELKNNQQQVLSLVLSNYTYHDKAAHGMTFLKGLTFNLPELNVYQLNELFKPGTNYVEVISAHVAAQIKQRDLPLLQPFEAIKPDQDFYIADKTLVIFFQLYELVAYAFGFQYFPISIYDLSEIINEDGPLGRML
ncbi:protein of unknown function [Amphibacillus marinus]|uniref:DUF3298 domain-containing protein n=1 Tax=Amphibacillus marinus TaxID=872970 RepID=A0A1H8M8V0_9BACI|nr:DUF3298 and DUF4163 domain-containing protein [Amphibacillus marinus]SEO13753.1 protein of unknown function [Amphibacillus marinus]